MFLIFTQYSMLLIYWDIQDDFLFCTDCSASEALSTVSGTAEAHSKCKLLLLTNLKQIITTGAKIWAHFCPLSLCSAVYYDFHNSAFLLSLLSFCNGYNISWVLRSPLNLRSLSDLMMDISISTVFHTKLLTSKLNLKGLKGDIYNTLNNKNPLKQTSKQK